MAISPATKPIRFTDELEEIERIHAADKEAWAMTCEAVAWELWRGNWKPSLADRFLLFLYRQRGSLMQTIEEQDLCRIRYCEHRSKHPLKG